MTDPFPTPHRDEQGKFAKRPVDSQLLSTQTGEQNPGHSGYGNSAFSGGMLWANGGSFDNPMGFPGYNTLYTGSYINYRFMLQHPILRLVRSIATADILCNKWEYVGENEKDVKLVQQIMDPLRMDLLQDFYMRGRDFGWQGGELIWEIRDTTTWLTRVKPLLVDSTLCIKDELGDFSGLLNQLPVGIDQIKAMEARIAAPYKAWKFTYDPEAGYLYGRSWLENARVYAWKDWLDTAQQLQRLGAKITGIQLILTSPAGSFPGPPDSNGKPTQIFYRDTCEKIIKALANGAPGAWLPSLNLPIDVKGKIDTAKIIAELAQKSLISAQLLNHGTNTPAIEGLLKRMVHDEELMFAGGLRPPQTGLLGEGGKSNTAEHKDTGSMIAQLEDQNFAHQCQPLVNAILVLNRGESKRDTVRIMPPSIVDNKRAYMKAILLAAMNDPTIAREMLRIINVNQELANIDIRTVDNYDPKRVEKADQKQLNTNKQPSPQGGRPTKDSGGNPKRRPTK